MKRRFLSLLIIVFCLFLTLWVQFSLQQEHCYVVFGINRTLIFLLINITIIFIAFLFYLIIKQSIKLFMERRKKIPGSGFKRDVLFAFILFSVVPSFFISLVTGKFIIKSIDSWFQTRIDSVLKKGLNIHELHTQKVRKELKKNSQCVVSDILKQEKNKENEKPYLDKVVTAENYEWYYFEKNQLEEFFLRQERRLWRNYRKINDRTTRDLKKNFLSFFQQNVDSECFDFFGSLYYAKNVGKKVLILVHRYEETVRNNLIAIHNIVHDYDELKSIQRPIKTSYFLLFLLIIIVVLFLSFWCAFYISIGITRPIQYLLTAITNIKNGKFNHIIDYKTTSELHIVIESFNGMTSALEAAQKSLIAKNKEIFELLENVYTPVFLVNKFGRLIMYNNSAKLFVKKYLNKERFKNKKIWFFGNDVKQQFLAFTRIMRKTQQKNFSREVVFTFCGEVKTLMVHMTAVQTKNSFNKLEETGLAIVIEDLSDIVKINKMKTWREAAKQMAHEIKNPLTPIQLATQRLQRRYAEFFKNKDNVFIECTNVILKQVNLIKNLTRYFSEFASMPHALNEKVDINNIIQETVKFYGISYPNVVFRCYFDFGIPVIYSDNKRIKRVFINLFDNSIKAFSQQKGIDRGHIVTVVTKKIVHMNNIEIIVSDNGPGINRSVQETLFLPYVSGTKKNMGLGLAIVNDIIMQQKGSIKLLYTKEGTSFQILLPINVHLTEGKSL
jgi:two-component system, NtrC family, nitrogen regulation sensor histidine kinase NtrY